MEKLDQSRKYDESQSETPNKNSSQLVEQNPIPDTPFTALKIDDKWYLTMGKYRLTQELKSEAAVIEAATDASWHRVMQIIQIMIDEDKLNSQPKQK